uniref:relaxase/mobilization nuclease domain-containing protein n=1 Tax=Alistipes putredinis TaxID=28117 RepID=UPI003966B774
MIAKIVKGSNFKGVVSYILDKEKDAKILVCDGLFSENKETITSSFEAQARMNPKVTKPVGHIALAFSKEDEHRLTNRAMAGIALEYLNAMGITDTQILIVRHFDKEHPHVHIVFNRIANDGRTISDRNERIRSTRVCKELTRKYGLYFADGKEQVKRHRLKEPDKTKYELYSILTLEVSRCGNWNMLITNLKKQGVEARFKYKGCSDEVQGVVFSMNGYSFSGSKIDRWFSYSKINAALNANRHEERQRVIGGQAADYEYPMQQSPQIESRGSDDLYSGSIGLFMSANANAQADENYFEEQLKRKNKKKKQRKIRF